MSGDLDALPPGGQSVSRVFAGVNLDFLIPILLIGLMWSVLIVALTGVGLILRRLICCDRPDADGLVTAMWLGYAVLIIFLQIWHLWLRAGGGASFTAFVVLGLIGIILHFRSLMTWLTGSVIRHYLAWPLMILLIAWAAHRSAGACTCPDSGLYHINAVNWAAQHPIIIGIANLHDRLAFNNTNFLVGGMLEFGMWIQKSHHLANGLLVAMLMITAIKAIAHGWQKRARLRGDHVFGAMLLMVAALFSVHDQAFNISSHASNLAAAVTVMAALYLMLQELHRPKRSWASPQSDFAVLGATALLTASVTIKLSTAVTCGLAWVILVMIWWRRKRKVGGPHLKPLALIVGVSVLLMGPWTVRTVLLSGYPAFPKTVAPFDVDWRYPTEQADYLSQLITTWAQAKAHPGQIKGWEWLKPWWEKLMAQPDRYEAVVIGVYLACGGLVVMLLRVHRVWRYRMFAARTLWLLPPILAGLVFWFKVAPDPRFAAYLFYSLAAMIVAIALGTSARSRRSFGKRVSLLMCLLLIAVPILYRSLPRDRRMGRTFAQTLKDVVLDKPGPNSGFYELPKPQLVRRVTDSGLDVYLIRRGGATWAGPLMSTAKSRYTPRLQLRDPKKGIRGGLNLAPQTDTKPVP